MNDQIGNIKQIVKGSLSVAGVNCHLYGILAKDYVDYYEDSERGEVIHIAVLGYEFDLSEDDMGFVFVREFDINKEAEHDPEFMEAYRFELVNEEKQNE